MARPKQVSDEQLRKMAHDIFLERGANTSVSVIAKRLGVTCAALYHRVGSKEQLLLKALWPATPPEMEILRKGFQKGASSDDQLVDILSGLSRYLSVAVPAIFMLHAGGVPRPKKSDPVKSEPPMITMRRLLGKWLMQAYKAKGLTQKSADVLANALIGTMEGHYMHAYLLSEEYSPRKSRSFVESLVTELMS